MHRLPVDDISVTPFLPEVGGVTWSFEGSFPETSVLLRRPGLERHFERSQILRIGGLTADEIAK